MKTSYLYIAFLGVFLLINGCEKNNQLYPDTSDESFLPMQVGNYWKLNDLNYTEITDTVRINGELFYKFYSLIGGDAIATEYLMIDNNQNLFGSDPDTPEFKFLHAKFNANVGDVFYTLNDSSVNDYRVEVVKINDSEIEFKYQMIYHPALSEHSVTYIRGIGKEDNWKEICIDGTVYYFLR